MLFYLNSVLNILILLFYLNPVISMLLFYFNTNMYMCYQQIICTALDAGLHGDRNISYICKRIELAKYNISLIHVPSCTIITSDIITIITAQGIIATRKTLSSVYEGQ